MTRFKMCGLTRPEDVELAIELGASWIGFVLEPSSPRCVGDSSDLPARYADSCPTVGVSGPYRSGLDLSSFAFIQCTEGNPPLPRIRAVRVRPDLTPHDVVAMGAGAQMLLLDGYHPQKAGGTGNRVDLSFAQHVVELSPIPVVLAGGLTPSNVAEAVKVARPHAVDVSSGIEASPGIKDADLMRAFADAVRSA